MLVKQKKLKYTVMCKFKLLCIKFMNICFISGKLYIKEDFKFVYNDKSKLSVITLYIVVTGNDNRKDYIIAKAYNEKADYIASRYKNGNNITFIGEMRENYIEITSLFWTYIYIRKKGTFVLFFLL